MREWYPGSLAKYAVIFHLEATVADAGNAQSYTDVCGGSISVHSPLSGTELARCDAFHVDRGSFVPAVRAMCAEALQHPPFAMTFLERDQIMAEDVTWCDLGRPHSIQVVLHPQANLWNRKLILAVKEDCAQSVRLYLQRGQSPNTKYHTGFTALSRSVYLNSMSACAILLQGRADPNLRDASGQSCLHIAVEQRNLDATRLLLKHAADPNACDASPDGRAPLQLAAQKGQEALLDLLLKHGASPCYENSDKDSAFTLACTVASTAMVLDALKFDVSWESILLRHAYSLAECLGCTLTMRQTSKCMILSMPVVQVPVDVLGGAEPVLRKNPEVWLQLSHNRASALARRWEESLANPKSEEELIQSGMSPQQAQYYVASYKQAKARQAWLRGWDAAMAPMIRQSYGVRGAPRAGVRIPLPPISRPIPTLPACAPEVLDMDALDLTWLRLCNPHLRDERINFVTEGHKYYIDGEPVDASVTGYVACFSEAWGLGLMWVRNLKCVYKDSFCLQLYKSYVRGCRCCGDKRANLLLCSF